MEELQTGRAQPAAQYANCVNQPLLPGADEELIMDLLPPMELHLLLGAVNRLIQHLEERLRETDAQQLLDIWLKKLGLSRPSYHGGQFEGNGCRRLLRGTDQLQNLAEQAGVVCAMPVVVALQALHGVVGSCFGATLADDTEQWIDRFRQAYLNLGIPVTTKVHAIFVHVAPFCRSQGEGLGVVSEQAAESAHADFARTWRRYKVAPANAEYLAQLLRATLSYNCRHI